MDYHTGRWWLLITDRGCDRWAVHVGWNRGSPAIGFVAIAGIGIIRVGSMFWQDWLRVGIWDRELVILGLICVQWK